MDKPRILIAAGGTGGHVYPAIAIADALTAANAEILFAGTRTHMEWQAVPKAGYTIKSIWISGFHRQVTLKNLLFPVKLIASIMQSNRIIREFKPHATVACGGYAAGPVGWVSAKKNIPLVLQEQNSYPGITNRLLAKYAEKIFTAFDAAANYLPASKIMLTGNPIRAEINRVEKSKALNHFGFTADMPVLLVLGGSGGAKTINNAMKAHITNLHDEAGLQIIWQCGRKYFDELQAQINPEAYKNLRLMGYLEHMPEAYSAADLVISRAGASSCSELMLTGKPSILVPSPNVAGNHQTMNAKSMVEAGASLMLKDTEMKDTLTALVESLIRNQERLRKMNLAALQMAKPEAANIIAHEILEIVQNRLSGGK